jgi:hypothetical protein
VCCSQIFSLLDVVSAVQQLFLMNRFAAARGTACNPELHEEWSAAREQGAQQVQVFVQAQLQGGVWVTSRSHTRHQTRNGSRLLVDLSASGSSGSSSSSGARPRVAEVEYYVRLQQLGDISDVIVTAMLCVLKTKPVTQHPVAELVLKAYDGVYEKRCWVEMVRAVPLQHNWAALNASFHNVDRMSMLYATPVMGRSKRGV